MEKREQMEKICKRVEEAIEKIVASPLTAQNIEMLYHLVKTEKEIEEIKRFEHGMGRTRGGAGGRADEMFGEIAERWTDYTDAKQRYRESHSDMDRRRMVDGLRLMLLKLNDMVQEILTCSECTEEREILENYRGGIL